MKTCIICRFDVPLDDAMVPAADGRCICLYCFQRETASRLAVPDGLRSEVEQVLEDIAAASGR